jgi:hypothetical protein
MASPRPTSCGPRSNLDWSRQRGGVEVGARHYPVMVVLHTGLLAGCLVEAITMRLNVTAMSLVSDSSSPSRIGGSLPRELPITH